MAQWITARGRREMKRAATRLPSIAAPRDDAPQVAFLTGQRFWYQTAFCLWSLSRHAGHSFRATFYDDGTFDTALSAETARLFPGSRVVFAGEIEARLDNVLPEGRYPTLRHRRREYPNLRKLTDVHAGQAGWQLVLDSDMLFFRRPEALLTAHAMAARPLHMEDVGDAYGYSRGLLERLAGKRLPSRLNVGVCGLHSQEIDWDLLERWSREMQEAEGTSYYQEQALVAMLLAGRNAECLPAPAYRLMPDEDECRRPSAILHHYVDVSKRGYFRHGWRHVIAP